MRLNTSAPERYTLEDVILALLSVAHAAEVYGNRSASV